MRRFAALALLAALAAVAWSLWRPETPAPAPGTAREVEAPPAATEAQAAAAAGPAAARAEVAAWSGPVVTVQVVSLGSNATLPGAEVLYQPPEFDWVALPEAEQRELSKLRNEDGEAFLRRIGRSARADASGRCTVPVGERGCAIAGRAGEAFGEGWLREGVPDPFPLVLWPDRSLRVRVLAADGQGASEIGIELRRPNPDGGHTRSLLGTTDAAGALVRAHAQAMAGSLERRRATLLALLPGGEGPTAEVDLVEPPPEVVLHLPPAGSVTVRVLEASGAPVAPRYLGEQHVELAGFDAPPANPNLANDAFRRECRATLDERGVAVFRHVSLGRYVIVRLGPFELEKGFAGPTVATPAVEVALQRAVDGALLVGRLLDSDARPFASRTFQIGYRHEGGMASTVARTDGEGRFRWHAGQPAIRSEATVFANTTYHDRANPMAVELPGRRLAKGENDLGDVRLEPHRTLLAGRLVRGPGVDAARVALHIERQRGGRWTNDHAWQAEWPEEDRFVVRGVAPAGEPLRLVVQDGPYLPVKPIECAVGSTDLEIPLGSAASATAVFLVDERTPIHRLWVRLERTQPPEPEDLLRRFREDAEAAGRRRDEDGRFRRAWSGLQPGAYRLTVRCPGVREPVAMVDDIRVGSGPCADPRLQAIDLRGRVLRFEVRATGAGGSPIAGRDAFVLLLDEDGDCYGYNLASGVAEVVTTGPVDLRVLAPGHVFARAPAVAEDITVALQPAPETRLQVALPAPLPDDVELEIRCRPRLSLSQRARITLDTGRGMMLHSLFEESVVIAADGSGVLRVRCPSEHDLGALLRRAGGGTRHLPLAPARAELGTVPAKGPLALSFAAGAFAEALRALGR